VLKQKDETAIHTLLTREIRPIRNWNEWLARWQAAEDIQWMESLLHVGFSISFERQYGEREYDRVDRYIFYFTIADGWADDYLLKLKEDEGRTYSVGQDANWNTINKTPSELRQQVARKAFNMLCMNLFKIDLGGTDIRGDGRFDRIWEESIASERLLPVIQNFFRLEESRYGSSIRIRNLSYPGNRRPHNEQQAINFLLNLAKFLWGWKKPNTQFSSNKDEMDKHFAAKRVCLDAAKPWMTEILVELNELDVLRERILELDDACLAKLREIALHAELSNFRHPVMEDRSVATLNEACYVDSRSAWLLKVHELKAREDGRLRMIRESEQQKVDADYRIQKLTGK